MVEHSCAVVKDPPGQVNRWAGYPTKGVGVEYLIAVSPSIAIRPAYAMAAATARQADRADVPDGHPWSREARSSRS